MLKFFIIAGPNGAGKSTSAPGLLRGARRVDEFVNADVIARDEGLSDVAAGRRTLERLDALTRERRDIAFETTLSSKFLLGRIETMRRRGYRCHLTFLWLPSADMAVERVAQRVLTGGHHIPEHVVRRRYERGLENFFDGYAAAVNSWVMIDNTERQAARLIARCVGGVLHIADNGLWDYFVRRYVKPRADEPAESTYAARPAEDLEWNAACDADDVLRAVNEAVQAAIARHRERGEPIVVWRDGKIVWLKPGEY
jgi:predicted ABC-type ATPase